MTESHLILIVDDSLTQLAVLQDLLQSSGYATATAQNGMQAIASVYHSPPDLILSDILMPELNGYHLCRLLKNDPLTKDIPIILLSNLSEPNDRFWGEKAGADFFLEKSTDLDQILAAVQSFLTSRPPKAPPSSRHLNEPEGKDIRNQITGILDRLLYESTISNEVLKLTRLTHDTTLMAKELFNFLSIICRYSAAGILIREGTEKYLLCLQLTEPVPTRFVEQAKKVMLRDAGLDLDNRFKCRFVLIDQEHVTEQATPAQFQVIKAIPIRDGNELLASITLFEGGKRRLTDGMRHALDIIGDRFQIVAQYLKQIKEIENVKADLVSMLVHDMRSPLTGISGFTDVLAEGILGQVSTEQRDALKNIQGGCDQLLQLIDDILDYSKLEAGKMKVSLSPLNLGPLVHQVINPLSAVFAENGLALTIDIPACTPQVLADEKQLSRVFANLLSNAAKFTPQGGQVTISVQSEGCCPETRGTRCLCITITDTGCGIPAEQQKILFNRYEQLPTATVYRKGTGLGLAICKEIINLHNGEIWVDSPADQKGHCGSRFTFTLPIAQPKS
ncbi:hybrid sensor histidine kinase/response regulator [Trichloromonas sp.]|uniref:hybrid sensor histidine kinase/response regulator n=1 Tax=Trichloromonas sp. TaxID=3069249 RepID=UPI003D81C3D9